MGYMLDFQLTEMDVYGIRTNSGKKRHEDRDNQDRKGRRANTKFTKG